jgi:hypothetical protein
VNKETSEGVWILPLMRVGDGSTLLFVDITDSDEGAKKDVTVSSQSFKEGLKCM